MSKIIILFLLFAKFLFANINSNGFVGSVNNFDFQENQDYSIDSGYLDAISNISCGDGGSDSTITILQNVDLKSGKFTCLKYLDAQSEPQRIDFSVDTARLQSEKAALKNFIDKSLSNNISFYNQLGSYVFPGTQVSGATNYISSVDVSDLYNRNKSLSSLASNNYSLNITIDSHTNANQTLSNILTGIFMLNPDYFQNDVITDSGTLKVKDYALDNGSNSQLNQQPGVIDSVIRFFVKEKNENVELSVVSLTDFMDKKFWGYYVYYLINIERAFNYIIVTLMLFGVTFIAARHGYQKFKKSVLKEENRTTDANGGGIVLNGILAISFFLIPVQTAQITVPEKFLYESQNGTTTNFDNEFYQQSTMAKATLRYFAEMGSTWANTVSDYSLYAYLRFLETKQGFITSRQVTQNEDAIKKLFEEIFYLKKDFDFLNLVCKPAYSSYLSTNQRFNTVSKEGSEALFSPINLSSSAIGEALKIDRIAPEVCQKIEKDVFTNSRKILSDYAFLRQQLKINEAILSNSSNTEAQKVGFSSFVDLIKFQQNSFGWINSVSVPVTYNLFFQNSNPVFNEDIQLEKIKESNDYNIISAWSKNEEQKTEIKNSIDDSILASVFGHIQSKFVWFMIPGFENVYEKVHQYFSNVAGLDPTAQQIKEKESNLGNAISSAKYFVASAAAGPLGMLSSAIMSVVSTFGGFISKAVTSALQYGILMYVSLVVAIFIMTMMITSLMLIVVATFSIIKIVMHFLEIIILAVTVDLLLFYALVTNKKEYFENFIGKSLVILILTPLSVVFASYLYIFISTAAIELYLMLIGMTFDTMSVANQTIIANSDNSFFNGLNALISAISLKSLGVVVIHFLSAFIGVYLIFKLKDMILNMMGINSDDSNISKLTETLQGKLTGDTVRV